MTMHEPLVLLPGMMCDARLFAPQIAAFSASRAVHVAPITRGETITEIAQALLDDAPPQFALLGLSMGAIVAMEVLRLAPARVTRIAMLNTNHRAESDKVRAMREPQIARAQHGELAAVMRDEMKPNYLADGPNRTDILALCMDMATNLGAGVFVRQSRALQTRLDQTETLSNATLAALALGGAEDVLCPPFRHEQIASLMPNAKLAIIENAGHLTTLEQPDIVNAHLKKWLSAK